MLSAKQIEQIKEQAFMCCPSQLENICTVRPLPIKEIIKMGSAKYNGRLGLLLLDEIEIAKIVKEKTGEDLSLEQIEPLAYLLQSAVVDDTFLLELQSAFSTFIQEEILLLPKINSVLVGNPSEKKLINSKNYRDFQDILRIQNKKEIKEPPPENETAGQRKMRLLREKVAQVKKKQAEKNGDSSSLVDMLEIAKVYGIDVEKCSLYALYSLIRRYQAKEKWEQDIQMLCAGADSKKIKTKYWGENLDE